MPDPEFFGPLDPRGNGGHELVFRLHLEFNEGGPVQFEGLLEGGRQASRPVHLEGWEAEPLRYPRVVHLLEAGREVGVFGVDTTGSVYQYYFDNIGLSLMGGAASTQASINRTYCELFEPNSMQELIGLFE